MRRLYVVRDNKAEDVGDQVLVCKSDSVAVRAFTDGLQNPSNGNMHRYPEDFDLLCIGSLDDTGFVENEGCPRLVLQGAQWKLAQVPPVEAVV